MRSAEHGGFLAGALVAITSLTAAMPAGAADIPAKAPVIAPAAAYNWTGFYLGANVGYSVGRNHGSELSTIPPGPPFSNQSFTLGPAGWLGGGQIGYNWQADHWVFGIEADWQGTGQKDSICISTCSSDGFLSVEQKLHWLATLRARIGYARDGWLWYVTGGGAFGRVTEDDALRNLGTGPVAASFSHSKGGWTAGAGVETALTGNWTAKLEYLYVDLGSTTDAFTLASDSGVLTQTITKQVQDHIIRLGLNYRFGASAAAVPAYAARAPSAIYKAPPPAVVAYNWTGFYLGGNAGYGVGRNHSNEIFGLDLSPPISRQSFTLGPAGWLGGGQVGYNWQPGTNWVFGAEADWQWTDQKDSVCITVCVPSLSLAIEQKMDWLATLRARIGYARDGWLWYMTGGGAWGRLTENDALFYAGSLTTRSFAQTKSGWTVGSGIETVLAGTWTAKLEYLYVDLGRTTDTFAFCPFVDLCASQTVTKDVRDHIFRAGLNYKLGGPLVARY
jgi:outer membrane immunogenic protein